MKDDCSRERDKSSPKQAINSPSAPDVFRVLTLQMEKEVKGGGVFGHNLKGGELKERGWGRLYSTGRKGLGGWREERGEQTVVENQEKVCQEAEGRK